jgi:Asp-tRNA(Asn)/Glu-tRNA(Gln) amidotransferase A subunit family amidase
MSFDERIRAGRSTPRAYLDETLARIKQLDPDIGAFVALNLEGAIDAAEASTVRWRNGRPLSPIDGMPVAIKDIIETADMPTGQGSPLFEGQESRRDSASVHALREAGAIIIGKTTTTEFAATHPWHKTKNPHDGSRTPGGSSSGSAAAVGSGMVPAALGTQVVGSILRPSSFGAIGSAGVARSTGGSHDHFSQSCQGDRRDAGRHLLVLRAIADRVGGDPGFVGLEGETSLRGPGHAWRF